MGAKHRLYADIHNGFCDLTGLEQRRSEQQVKMVVGRRKRDNEDLKNTAPWFKERKIFFWF